MNSENTARNKFIVMENDQFSVDNSDIIAVLPNAEVEDNNGALIYKFKKDVDVQEM